MPVGEVILAGAGSVVLLLTLADALITILSVRGGGPLTAFVSRKIWGGMLKIHQVRKSHKLLSVTGPVLMLAVVLAWYALMYLGWFLVFSAFSGNIVSSSTLAEAQSLEKLYFTGVTISGLGYGDFVPRAFPWTMLSTVAVFSTTLLTSLSLSYIIGVVPVVLQKRQLAQQNNAVVEDWSGKLKDLTNPDDVNFIWQQLFSLQLDGTKFSTKYGAYPIAAYFHAADSRSAYPMAYLKAADTMFYVVNHPSRKDRPTYAGVETWKRLLKTHVANMEAVVDIDVLDGMSPDNHLDAPAEFLSMQCSQFTWSEYALLRHKLVLACLYDGWRDN
ncbi:ion channel [Gilvimarinus chinensis]|uniref:ion channel n=1 Tax=Gilvimarinus chinensis TaxID=396005 RepID=UPI00035FF3E2|nr:ion channel [Gilvimarinus chinensis]